MTSVFARVGAPPARVTRLLLETRRACRRCEQCSEWRGRGMAFSEPRPSCRSRLRAGTGSGTIDSAGHSARPWRTLSIAGLARSAAPRERGTRLVRIHHRPLLRRKSALRPLSQRSRHLRLQGPSGSTGACCFSLACLSVTTYPPERLPLDEPPRWLGKSR